LGLELKEVLIPESWARYSARVAGHKNNSYKNFPTKEEAQTSFLEYMSCDDAAMESKVFPKSACSASATKSLLKMKFLIPAAMFLSFVLLFLLFYIPKRCCKCP